MTTNQTQAAVAEMPGLPPLTDFSENLTSYVNMRLDGASRGSWAFGLEAVEHAVKEYGSACMALKEVEVVRLRSLCDTLKLEAQIHAGEARSANHTIGEIYQCVTGSTGEPGNWHGAVPVREKLTQLREALKDLLDGIHAGRFIPVSGSSEGYTNALIQAGELAINQPGA